MAKEQTYEQWEISVKEKMADVHSTEMLGMAEGIVIHLLQSIWAMRTCLEVSPKPDDFFLQDLLRRIGETAVTLDALQLKFGDAADEEVKFLQALEEML